MCMCMCIYSVSDYIFRVPSARELNTIALSNDLISITDLSSFG